MSALLLVFVTVVFAQNKPPTTAALSVAQPLVWTDENAILQLPAQIVAGQIAVSVQLLNRAGLGQPTTQQVKAEGGLVSIAPQAEGIHIVRLQNGDKSLEVRFLAIRPPAPLDKIGRVAVLRSLPQTGKKLLGGEPFTILAMGDSVTATGNYAAMFAKMLDRATGNQHIRVEKRAYSGRSIDATVRNWDSDVRDIKPDLGLLMYGLNDQITFYPLDAYLEQYQWVAQKLKKQFGADTVFLQPTPDISGPVDIDPAAPDAELPAFAFRTIGFGESLRPLARELGIPLAETFDAIWGEGGPTLTEAALRLGPVFPPGYSKQFHSLLETGGKGDTIHPNALGHLAMARAVFNAITEQQPTEPLQITAQSRWTTTGVQSEVTLRNRSVNRRAGEIKAYPLVRGRLESEPFRYNLAPGESAKFNVSWPQAREPRDLWRFPNDHYLTAGRPIIPLVDVVGETSHIYAPVAPFEVDATFDRDRQIVPAGKAVRVGLLHGGKREQISIKLPDAAVGAIPLLHKVEQGGKTGWAGGELRFTRFGAARDGQADVDGDLKEWQNQAWVPVGEPFQARYSNGMQDNSATPREAYLHWAFKAGKDGLYLAAKTEGSLQNDNFTLYFDPRFPQELGTPGRYYWASGKLLADGKLELRKGETSAAAPAMSGAWRQTETGLNLEIFVPYALFEQTSWPAAGDLGLSIWWVHFGPDGRKTNLMWSEEGHPWNPRWYGVVRRSKDAAQDKTMPVLARVR